MKIDKNIIKSGLQNNAQYMELYNKVNLKAWTDDNYKTRLINSPKKVLASEDNMHFSSDLDLKVYDSNNKNINDLDIQKGIFPFILLPKAREIDELDLEDEDLESVSGGDGGAALMVGTWLFVSGCFIDDAFDQNQQQHLEQLLEDAQPTLDEHNATNEELNNEIEETQSLQERLDELQQQLEEAQETDDHYNENPEDAPGNDADYSDGEHGNIGY